MDYSLVRSKAYTGVPGPLVLVVLDGMGLYKSAAQGYPGNAIDQARTPLLDRLMVRSQIFTSLKAHGTAVGLPSDGDMGNSEVGHNALGAGRVFDQGAKLVAKAIQERSLFEGEVWSEFIGNASSPGHILKMQQEKGDKGPAVHFIGLLSDGNVHSHIEHLLALIEECAEVGVKKVFIHPLLDGRDVEEISAEKYITQLENVLQPIRESNRDYWIASGGGRMVVTMDRYEADWDIVARGWKTHVHGEGRKFPDALTAIETLRSEKNRLIDQDLPPFVIVDPSQNPRGPIQDDDVVIFFNYRGDRAIEISRAFTEDSFTAFDRARRPAVKYAGMMQYDGDLQIPPKFLVSPPLISRTISQYLVSNKISTYALSETQKFGHVTYFWNGNNSEKFDARYEKWVEVKSDILPFEEKPAMKAYEITDNLISELKKGTTKFLRVNFANGDMVGHTGNLAAAIQAVEAVDRNLHRIIRVLDRMHGTIIITADHGNCDQMLEVDKKTGRVKEDKSGKAMAKTSHTLNPVPCILHGPHSPHYHLNKNVAIPGLANVAATILNLLGFERPEDYEDALIVI